MFKLVIEILLNHFILLECGYSYTDGCRTNAMLVSLCGIWHFAPRLSTDLSVCRDEWSNCPSPHSTMTLVTTVTSDK